MERPLFLRLRSLSNYDNYFIQKHNNARKLGLAPIQKCTAALRMLAYGFAADVLYSQVLQSDNCFVSRQIPKMPKCTRFADVTPSWTRSWISGMIGNIDCMHWQLENYPKAWQWKFTSGHKGTTTIILEAVVSYDLWKWHAFFGLPGTLNDINVLDRSPVFDDIESGEAPHVTYTVNGRKYNLTYYLADGIYPKWVIFVQSLLLPQGNEA